jgi:glycosyltransferase involved in cell wall biosynthesis
MHSQPQLSIIVAVRDGASTLARALQAIVSSDLPRHSLELIVVDDASTDGSAVIGARYADTVIRLSARRSGLAYARNRGAEIARADAIAFIESDVGVRPDTLRLMLQALDDPGINALCAGRDGAEPRKGLTSQYWSLLHRFGERAHPRTGGTFASGCVVIRRSVLVASGMFDEWRFGSGSLEGVELGQRLAYSGHRVTLSPDVTVAHLREWTVGGVIREAFARSALLSRSLGYVPTRISTPGDVVFTLSRTAVPVLAVVAITALSGAFMPPHDWWVRAAIALALVVLVNSRILRSFVRERGIVFALLTLPLHLISQAVSVTGLCLGWLMRDTVGDRLPDAATQAYAEVGLEMWPPVPRRR